MSHWLLYRDHRVLAPTHSVVVINCWLIGKNDTSSREETQQSDKYGRIEVAAGNERISTNERICSTRSRTQILFDECGTYPENYDYKGFNILHC